MHACVFAKGIVLGDLAVRTHCAQHCMAESQASAELLRIDRARLLTANLHLERSNIELREALQEEPDPDYQQAIEAYPPPPPPPSPSLLFRQLAVQHVTRCMPAPTLVSKGTANTMRGRYLAPPHVQHAFSAPQLHWDPYQTDAHG